MSEPKQIKVGELIFETFREKRELPGEIAAILRYRWHCKAANGEKVCTSGESFDSKGNAERAMTHFVALACHQEYLQVIEALMRECLRHDSDGGYATDREAYNRASVLLAHRASFQEGEGK